MEDNAENKEAEENIWIAIKNGIFNVFVEMLKDRKISRLNAATLYTILFLQIYGTLIFPSTYIIWSDDICASTLFSYFGFIRIVPAIISIQSVSFFWLVYGVGNNLF